VRKNSARGHVETFVMDIETFVHIQGGFWFAFGCFLLSY